MKRRKDTAASPEAISETFTCPQTPITKKNKKRFSDEQIRSLESIFKSETMKLEPRKKLQLAEELGLQPRQVAIWFQNRRARLKSKQMEHDYEILRANYDSLATRFESLKKENESLLLELQTLNERLEKTDDENNSINDMKRSYLGNSKKGNDKSELGEKISFLEEGMNHENNIDIGHYDSVVSSEKWYGNSFNSGGILDPSTSNGTSHWLNFWV